MILPLRHLRRWQREQEMKPGVEEWKENFPIFKGGCLPLFWESLEVKFPRNQRTVLCHFKVPYAYTLYSPLKDLLLREAYRWKLEIELIFFHSSIKIIPLCQDTVVLQKLTLKRIKLLDWRNHISISKTRT